MKYYVKVIRDFDDYGGKEVKQGTKHIQRYRGELYYCDRGRYFFLKEHNVVELMWIIRQSK